MERKVFWGVLCALLVFSGLCWAVFALGVFGARVVVARTAQQVQAQAEARVAQMDALQAAQLRYEHARAAMERSRRVLASNQRCVGGAVVQVDGTTYTQLGSIVHPVHCVGDLSDVPLR